MRSKDGIPESHGVILSDASNSTHKSVRQDKGVIATDIYPPYDGSTHN